MLKLDFANAGKRGRPDVITSYFIETRWSMFFLSWEILYITKINAVEVELTTNLLTFLPN